MAIFNINSKKIAELQTRVSTLERQIVEVRKAKMATLKDNPPTIEHQYAINEIIRLARALAEQNPGNPGGVADECLSWLGAIGR